ncbi:hypothetical protein [Olleya sp. Bg11-27]|uniref:hypothetical protein n=1 Tax=Olleya sp. Bg11-27 TaxID=2058135 RepID=UPI000C304E34|nr:hypothetical protein [Olleya sp. Bg11-27]AUC77441.1 hypothetical protein CW732_17880 [Olleya sp. Bg11-27]
MKYYFDTEDGPTRETSHPNFVNSMTSGFYYDCTDEFSPFGSDDGADLLYNLEDWYREKRLIRNTAKWMFNQIDEMGFEYKSKDCSELMDLKTIKEIQEKDEYLILSMDNSIIATGFGQIKITGKIDTKLKFVTLKALDRQILVNNEDKNSVDYISRMEKMKLDLSNFK